MKSRFRRGFGSAGLCGSLALGVVLLASPGWASDIPPGDTSPLVATWNGGNGVTVNDLVTWWDYGVAADRKPLNTIEEKEAFLNTVINAKLMIDKAESLGITSLPTVADFYRGRRVSLTNEAVFMRATTGRINVSEAEVDEVYRKRLTEMELSQIVVPKLELARSLEDSIKAGVRFDSLAVRYSIAPTANNGGLVGTVRWGDFAESFSAQAFRLESGQVSDPFQVPGGWCILKMGSKVLKDPADPAAERRTIRARLERDVAIKERSTYLDSLKTAYNFTVDVNAAVNLSAKYAIAIQRAGQEDATILDADIIPDLSPADRDAPLVTFRGGSITTGEMADLIANTPFQVRPRMDDPDELIPFITGKSQDSLVFAEGVKLGLDKTPEITSQVERARRRKTIVAFYNYVTREASVPEAEARAAFAVDSSRYGMQEGWVISKIVVGSMEAADSILKQLADGASFEEIARTKSRDPFTATEGGNVGFLPKGSDQEFDGFLETMQVGERKVFRSLEGIVILWLREKQLPRRANFEEARSTIESSLLEKHRNEILEKWATERRALMNVQVNRDMLGGIVLK